MCLSISTQLDRRVPDPSSLARGLWQRGVTRLPAVLQQGVVGVGLGQGLLLGTAEVEVVYAADERGDVLADESGGEGPDQGGLAGALDAIEADDEGAVRHLDLVSLKVLEDEGDAEGCPVVDEDGRLLHREGWGWGARVMSRCPQTKKRDVLTLRVVDKMARAYRAW